MAAALFITFVALGGGSLLAPDKDPYTDPAPVGDTAPDNTVSSDTVSSEATSSATPSATPSTAASSQAASKDNSPSSKPATATKVDPAYRAVWFSYTDLQQMLVGKSKAQFTAAVNSAFAYCKDLGLNRVVVQVRPFSDALYVSDIFPSSRYAVGTQGAAMSYDPLQIICDRAKAYGLAVEAWVNPYRISTGESTAPCDTNPCKQWEGTDNVVSFNGGLYYNPAKAEVQQLILDGVEEILKNYPVDGIHFDDYFYPSGITADFDSAAYAAAGGGKSLSAWRTENVNTLVKKVYSLCHSYGKTFTISPQGNVENCYGLYADVKLWGSKSGYCDYLVPQLYWGYDHSLKSARYTAKIAEWSGIVTSSKVKLVVGLGAYRIGQTAHGYRTAGTDMANQVYDAHSAGAYGFCLFRYGSLTESGSSTEMNNLKQLLQNGGI